MEVGTVLAIIQTGHSVLRYITRIVEGFHGDDTSQDKLIRLRNKVFLVTQTLERSKAVRGPHQHIDGEVLKTLEACARLLKNYDAAASQRGGVKPSFQRAKLVLDHRKIDSLNERLRDHVGELQLVHLLPHGAVVDYEEQTLVTPASSPPYVPSKNGKHPLLSASRAWTGDTYVDVGDTGSDQLSTSPSTTGLGKSRHQSGSPYFAPIPEDSELLAPGGSGAALADPWQEHAHTLWLEDGDLGSGSPSHDRSPRSGFTQSPAIAPTEDVIPVAPATSAYAPSHASSASVTDPLGAEVTIYLAKGTLTFPVGSLGITEEDGARVASLGTEDICFWHYIPRGNLGIPHTRPDQKEVDFLPRDQWHRVKIQRAGCEVMETPERPKYKFSSSSSRREFERIVRGSDSLQTFPVLEITVGSPSRTQIARDVDLKLWGSTREGNATLTFARNVSASTSKGKKSSGPKHAEYYVNWFGAALERSDSSKRISLKLRFRKPGDEGFGDMGLKCPSGQVPRASSSADLTPSSASRKSSVLSIGSISGYEVDSVPDAVAKMGSLKFDFQRSMGEAFAKAWATLQSRTPFSPGASHSYVSDSSAYPPSYTSSRPPSGSWGLPSPSVRDPSPRFDMLPPPIVPDTPAMLFDPARWNTSTLEEPRQGGDGYASQGFADGHTSSAFRSMFPNR